MAKKSIKKTFQYQKSKLQEATLHTTHGVYLQTLRDSKP